MFRRPSDGKVSPFLNDVDLETKVIMVKDFMCTFFGVTCFSFMEGERGSVFLGQLMILFP